MERITLTQVNDHSTLHNCSANHSMLILQKQRRIVTLKKYRKQLSSKEPDVNYTQLIKDIVEILSELCLTEEV